MRTMYTLNAKYFKKILVLEYHIQVVFSISLPTDQWLEVCPQEGIRCDVDRRGKEKNTRRTRGGGSITTFTRKGVKIEKIVGGVVTSDSEI